MSHDSAAPETERLTHRPWLAAVLSFLIPGMGQAYAGRPLLGLLLALPIVLVIGLITGIATGAIGGLRNSLFSSGFLVAVLVVNGLVLAWRGIAIAHAGLTPWVAIHGRDRRVAIAVVGVLLALTAAMHAWIGVVVLQFDSALAQVFEPERRPTIVPPGPGDDDPPQEPINEPEFEWDGTERVNILLLGTDAAPGRDTVLTDVMLVVSVDPMAETAVMISVPRDTGYVPLPDETLFVGGLYPDKVNELALQASLDPATWCPDLADDPEACGLRTIERSIGLYLGLDIHHYALVDMAGFAGMIDAIGGVDLCLEGRLVDPQFDGSLTNDETNEGLVLEAGCRPYNGIDALAYARSRQGWIEMPNGERIAADRFRPRRTAAGGAARDAHRADRGRYLPRAAAAAGRHRPHGEHRLPARPGRRLRQPPAADRRSGDRARRARLPGVRRPAARAGGQLPADPEARRDPRGDGAALRAGVPGRLVPRLDRAGADAATRPPERSTP